MGMTKRPVALTLALCVALLGAVPAAMAEEETSLGGEETEQTAGEAGETALPEEFWYIDAEIRARMEGDATISYLYDKAIAAKNRRQKTGNVLFIIGVPLLVGGSVIWLAPHAFGLEDDQGSIVGGSIATTGVVGFILPASLLRGIKSKAEKEFIEYMKEKYDVIPVVELPRVTPDGAVAWNFVNLQF